MHEDGQPDSIPASQTSTQSAERRAEIARLLADLGPVTRKTWYTETGRWVVHLELPSQYSYAHLTLAENEGITQADLALAEFLAEAPFAVTDLLAELESRDAIDSEYSHLLDKMMIQADVIETEARRLVRENATMRQALRDIRIIATTSRTNNAPLPAYVAAIADLAQRFLVEEDSIHATND